MDKASMTLGWLVGRQIAGQRRTQKKEPAAYTFGSTYIFPKIPDRDEKAFPYLAITQRYLNVCVYAFSTPLTAEPVTNLMGGIGYKFTSELPYLECELPHVYYEHDKWSEWKTVTDATVSIANYDNLTWVNHDVVATDGIKVLSGGDLIPVYLPIVLYDGEVTTEQESYANSASKTEDALFEFAPGDTLRVTVDGVSGEYTAEGGYQISLPIVGNAWLYESDAADNGGDFALVSASPGTGLRNLYFYTRTPGTYQLKVELISMGQ